MKRRLILGLGLAILAGVVLWLWTDHLRPSQQGGGIKSVAGGRGLVITTPEGRSVNLGKLQGKVVVVHFWATWCAPCMKEMPELETFWKRYQGRNDFALFAIATDKEGWEKVGPFVRDNGVDLPVYLDPGAKVAERFGTSMFPETYIVNRKGRVVQKIAEAISWTEPEVQQFFDQLLASAD